jgi:uncharacterized protein YdeI (YjbR/CyaY-like superfamily)
LEKAKGQITQPTAFQQGIELNSAVDWYFSKHTSWAREITKLRSIALACGLSEELKWGCPCYGLQGSNVVLIHVFKAYCALLFFKGALLNDAHGILVQQTKNVQSARQIRFTKLEDVLALEPVLKAYIVQAIAIEKSGLKVTTKTTEEFEVPAEFEHKLKAMPALKKAFSALTPGRQRAYLLHFSSAKQSKTRQSRIEKCMGAILDGKGLDD